jgi:hypothetical protein
MGLASRIKASYFDAGLGIRVPRVIAADAVGPTNLFTVAGGYIILTGLYGIVTAARTGGAGATQVFTHTATNLCIAGITGLATVGTVVTITGDPADALIIGVGTGVANTVAPLQGGIKGSGVGGMNMFGLILGVGSITTTISIVTTGATRYVISYIPIDDTARVRAV